jgi:hypothetical protein
MVIYRLEFGQNDIASPLTPHRHTTAPTAILEDDHRLQHEWRSNLPLPSFVVWGRLQWYSFGRQTYLGVRSTARSRLNKSGDDPISP